MMYIRGRAAHEKKIRLHSEYLSFTAFEFWRPDISLYHILAPIRDRATALSDASVCLAVRPAPHRNPMGLLKGGGCYVNKKVLSCCLWTAVRTGGRGHTGHGQPGGGPRGEGRG